MQNLPGRVVGESGKKGAQRPGRMQRPAPSDRPLLLLPCSPPVESQQHRGDALDDEQPAPGLQASDALRSGAGSGAASQVAACCSEGRAQAVHACPGPAHVHLQQRGCQRRSQYLRDGDARHHLRRPETSKLEEAGGEGGGCHQPRQPGMTALSERHRQGERRLAPWSSGWCNGGAGKRRSRSTTCRGWRPPAHARVGERPPENRLRLSTGAARQVAAAATRQRTSAMPSSMRMARNADSELMAPKQPATMPACARRHGIPVETALAAAGSSAQQCAAPWRARPQRRAHPRARRSWPATGGRRCAS